MLFAAGVLSRLRCGVNVNLSCFVCPDHVSFWEIHLFVAAGFRLSVAMSCIVEIML